MMRPSVVVRGIVGSLGGAVLVSAMLIPVGPALAEATIFRFSATHTETFSAPLEGCLPEDLVGTVTLTETSTGQVVESDSGVFTVRGVDVFDDRLDLPDGSYVQSGLSRDRFVFVANSPHTVRNVVTQDFRTIYSADGTPVGTLSIHAGFHVTFNDLNGNSQPDPGEIAAEFEYFRLRCG